MKESIVLGPPAPPRGLGHGEGAKSATTIAESLPVLMKCHHDADDPNAAPPPSVWRARVPGADGVETGAAGIERVKR